MADEYGYSTPQEDYELLRDKIIELFDPTDDDIAEPAIMVNCLEEIANQRQSLLAACEALITNVLSGDESRLGILMIGGKPVTGELLDRTFRIDAAIKQAREAIAKAKPED